MGELPTVTEMVASLRDAGFTADMSLVDGEVRCDSCGTRHAAADVVVHRVHRFEGSSDPDDEAIVLGVECHACSTKAVIVSAYGADADPAIVQLLRDR